MAVSRTNLSPVSELVDRAGPRRRRGAAPPDRGVDPRADPLGRAAGRASRCRRPARSRPSWASRAGVVVEAYAQLVAEGYLTSRSGGYTQVAPLPATAPAPAPYPPPPAPRSGAPGRARASRGRLRLRPRQPRRLPARRLAALGAPGAHRGARRPPRLPRRPRRDRAARGARRLPQPGARHPRRPRDDRHHQRLRAGGVAAARGAGRPRRDDGGRRGPVGLRRRPPDRRTRSGMEVRRRAGRRRRRARRRRGGAATPTRSILTPSHQWPTGGVLSPEARAAVLAWAQRTGALVIEDDYDAEYRYDRAPIGAMQGLDPDRVAYAGTASKTLAPGLPARLARPAAASWSSRSPRPSCSPTAARPILDQLTFADFLSRGEFDRHLRRMRPIYRSRRDALLAALAAAPARARAGRDRRRPAPGGVAARRTSTRRR